MASSAFSVVGFFAVGLGAVIGAWARWGLSVLLNPSADRFPVGTFVANLGGSYAIGLVVAWVALVPDLSPTLRLFLVTGLLGALTTFSTFSAESITFVHEGRWGLAVAYLLSTVFGCLAMTGLGWWTWQSLRS